VESLFTLPWNHDSLCRGMAVLFAWNTQRCETESEFSGAYLSPVEHWRASLLQPLSAFEASSPPLL
jgi:hypothetical protein